MNGKYSAGLSYLKQTMGALGDTSCSFELNHNTTMTC